MESDRLMAAEHISFCQLCGSTPGWVGAFVIPRGKEEIYSGLPAPRDPRKRRTVVYGLCRHCFELPDRADRVERRLASLFGESFKLEASPGPEDPKDAP
jgi:hypothetical protein